MPMPDETTESGATSALAETVLEFQKRIRKSKDLAREAEEFCTELLEFSEEDELEITNAQVERLKREVEQNDKAAEEAEKVAARELEKAEEETVRQCAVITRVIRDLLGREPDANLRDKFTRLAEALERADIPIDPVSLGVQLL